MDFALYRAGTEALGTRGVTGAMVVPSLPGHVTISGQLPWSPLPYPVVPPWGPLVPPLIPWSPLAPWTPPIAVLAGQDTLDPQHVAAVEAEAAKYGVDSEVAREALKAVSIIGTASAVPGIGTIGGAVVAAVVILGPRLFKGIASLFGGRENPWPGRVKKIRESNAPPESKMEALWAALQMAAYQTRSSDKDTRRWAEGGVQRLNELYPQIMAQLTPEQRERWDVQPAGVDQFMQMPPEQLHAFIASTEWKLANPSDPFWANPEVRRPAVVAQLAGAKVALARRTPPPSPPAPPVPATTPEQWHGWLAAALQAQRTGTATPAPPPIPPLDLALLPPAWAQWVPTALDHQMRGLVVPPPPPVDPRWVGQ